jgi:uncharacterized protein with beta-barrel porin domain
VANVVRPSGQGLGVNGGNGGNGISVSGFTINGVTIHNFRGIIGGGNGGIGFGAGAGGAGGNGIYIFGQPITAFNVEPSIPAGSSLVSNIRITNDPGSSIAGGNGGMGGASGNGGAGGNGIYIAGGILDHVFIVNSGVIIGGNGGLGIVGGDGGAGILLVPQTAVFTTSLRSAIAASSVAGNDLNIVNYGLIKGGAATAGGAPGIGIDLESNLSGNSTNLTITNWGVISSGAGDNGVAVKIVGSNNDVRLMGHSTVDGLIRGVGSHNSNFLDLDFSGVSQSQLDSLKQQLAAQGISPNEDSAGILHFRGMTIRWDPLVIRLNTSSYQAQGQTANESAVGANLDSIYYSPTGDFLKLLNAIDASGNVGGALSQLSPQRYEINSDIAFADANFNTLGIDERLNNLRDGSESVDFSGYNGQDLLGRGPVYGGGKGSGADSGADGKDNKGTFAPAPAPKYWGMFASGNAIFSQIDAHDGMLGDANFTSAGLITGLDARITDDLTAGILFSYMHTSANLDGEGSNAYVNNYTGGLYAGYHHSDFYLNGLATFGANTYKAERKIQFPGVDRTAQSSTDGTQFNANLDGGYDFHINNHLTISPVAGLQFVQVDVGGFDESGADSANLNVRGMNADSLRSRFGFRIDYHLPLDKAWAFAAEFRGAWQHEFLDDNRAIVSSFSHSSLSAFGVRTIAPQRDAALIGVGINTTYKDRATFFLDYDVQAGQADYLEQSVRGGFKWGF